MFLHTLAQTNRPLVDAAFLLHQAGDILPDSYLIDLDTFLDNAGRIKEAGDRHNVELYFMGKQMGRNPHLCKLLCDLGYPGAVVVDYREALLMMEHRIPIAHAGHLVQIPEHVLPGLIEYGAGMITVYSIEKAKAIQEICRSKGIIQAICLRVVEEGDSVYPGQEGGFSLIQLPAVLKKLDAMSHIRVSALTAFPCFLYSREQGKIEPTHNLQTVRRARQLAQQMGYTLDLNLPSCTQISLMPEIQAYGGKSGEPGSAFLGTLPNNETGGVEERLAIAYISEVSHLWQDKTYCYGGGFYSRGQLSQALVGRDAESARWMKASPFPAENIDYCLPLEGEGNVGDSAVMCFRPQIFTSRSQVVLLEGLSRGNPRIVAVYDARGKAV